MLKGSALNPISLAIQRPCFALCPLWLPHPSIFTLPFFLSLILSQLALSEGGTMSQTPCWAGEHVKNTQSCEGVLPGCGKNIENR